MRAPESDKIEAGIRASGQIINNLRHIHDIILLIGNEAGGNENAFERKRKECA